MPEETRESILLRIPLQRAGNPEDIALAVKFLLLEAPYITGHILPVDGGRSLFI
jgi:pteridine reductase